MVGQIRKHRVRSVVASAALLFAGAVIPLEAGSIDVRVTPEMRVVKTSPQPKTTTVNARWSKRGAARQNLNASSNSLRAVHYPTVVLGSVSYIQPSNATTTVTQNGGVAIASGELLPMTVGGFSVGVLADGTVVSGTAVTDAATVGSTVTTRAGVVTPVGVIRSDFIGIAGPGGSPFGIAGPAFLPDGTVVRPSTVNRSITSGVTSGARTQGVVGSGGTGSLVIGGGTGGVTSGVSVGGGGAGGNMVIGVGGAALSGGSGR